MNTNITQQNINEELSLFIGGEKYAEQDIHHISKWFCFLRDINDDPEFAERKEKVITMMRAFIARKKLGTPIVIKEIEKEFGYC